MTSEFDIRLQALADGKRVLPDNFLPRFYLNSRCLSCFRVASGTLILLLVPPLSKRAYIFTKDWDQFSADLKSTDDQATVIQSYRDAFEQKTEVCCGFLSDLDFIGLTNTRKFGRALEELGRTVRADRKAEIMVAQDKRVDQWDFCLCIAFSDVAKLVQDPGKACR